ncbi:HEPN domain-containing protein [Aeromonas salmonicida]|uniref:HEPN domain-containing protein n=1 Tax=Aeromonas salmonicida TaxID=645 RepID=UPI001112BF08|nr:HEPN domain-containing protein [Aeromonas salmonicida]
MIGRDIKIIFSVKGIIFPKNIEDIQKLGFFSPRVRIRDKEIYLSEEGTSSLKRISDIVNNTNEYKNSLNYDNIYQSVLSEISTWFNKELTPDVNSFLMSLDTVLSKKNKKTHFICRIDGISIDELVNLNVGGKTIRSYNNTDLNNASDASDNIKEIIEHEYRKSLVMVGYECGSDSVALEKFYFNANLSLSVLRLYSCALYPRAIHNVNIRLINDCMHSYGVASCIGQDEGSKDLRFIKYFRSTQDFTIDKELLEHLGKNMFFDTISSLVCRESRNELENAIIKSLYWIGESQKDQSHPSAFVKLWSALECFFTLGEGNITERNARGITSIIMFGEFHHKKFESYSLLKRKIKNHYKSRSKIIHHAEFSHIDNFQLEEMAFISSWVVIAMAALLERGYTKLIDIGVEAQRLDTIYKEKEEH